MTFVYYARTPLLIALALVTLLSGCVSSKKLVYFQSPSTTSDSIKLLNRFSPTIQPNDILSVRVSSLSPEASNFFNPLSATISPDRLTTQATASALPELSGYLVNADGTLELPLLGKVPVGGLTTSQATDLIRNQLKTYLKEPTVVIRNQNFRVSVMGEVARPSLFTIPNERITMLEALSLAGDITIFGRRDNVLLIREVNGVRTFTRIDLTSRALFSSPYYYLQPNDVLYVEPGKSRIASADRTFQILPIALSALSFLAIIFRYF
ncbi:polysaccharide biosynthesis/export family protein [Spirosoma sp.]|uniref:polysaccharide biosynthesis/export family protein n=1 Tax=Spirosoma sp. TaxID=1899569 RepID=UPI002611BBDF|nr:polysaccharide biosynthesis/export family protein [Spirosoma sp.]MCX6218968.1 polysaccharide biosynthesis/export family protein [Spirosoma sp.]